MDSGMGYCWLHPKTGGFSVFRMVRDYEEEKRNGFSIYEDHRDLDLPVIPVEIKVDAAPVEKADFTCEVCGKVCANKVGFLAHSRSHK